MKTITAFGLGALAATLTLGWQDRSNIPQPKPSDPNAKVETFSPYGPLGFSGLVKGLQGETFLVTFRPRTDISEDQKVPRGEIEGFRSRLVLQRRVLVTANVGRGPDEVWIVWAKDESELKALIETEPRKAKKLAEATWVKLEITGDSTVEPRKPQDLNPGSGPRNDPPKAPGEKK